MNNKGITLIELMIVIAILGILFNINGFIRIRKEYDEQERRINEQHSVLMFHKALKKLLRESKTFINVSNKKLITDKLKLMISKSYNIIYLNGKYYEFRNFRFSNFVREKDAVKCDVRNGNNFFNIFLVCGKSLDKQDEGINNENELPSESNEERKDGTAFEKEVSNE